MKNKSTNAGSGMKGASFRQAARAPASPVRTHERRLPVGGLCEADSRRAEKTEYVMRLLVRGRAPFEEAAARESKRPAAPEAMTLENLTFDDLLAELENL